MDANNNVIVTDVIAEQAAARMNALNEARTKCVMGIKAGDGLIISYARAISEVCGEGWVYLVGKESAPVREERKLFNRADRKSTRLNSSHIPLSRMPSSA